MTEAYALTADGALTLRVELPDGARADAVRRWRPASARGIDPVTPHGGTSIAVRPAATLSAGIAERGDAILTFGGVTAEARSRDSIALLTSTPGCSGSLHLDEGRAELVLDTDAGAVHAAPMLTLAAALLLGRMGRALVHGAAVVAPAGNAWLLVGDTHSGKTTTCATLLDAGWRYCSDDQVIISRGSGGSLEVEGWPRVFHLDSGYTAQRPAGGMRDDIDAAARWPGRREARAPLAGTLFPLVVADEPTAVRPVDAAGRLAAIVRQSPWLFADAASAPAAVALLRDVALLPGHTLQLGADSFAQPGPMVDVLRAVTG